MDFFPQFVCTVWLIFIGSGNKVLTGHPETGILKGDEQEDPVPVMERSSPARLNLPLTQGESQSFSYACVLFQREILQKSNSQNFGS